MVLAPEVRMEPDRQDNAKAVAALSPPRLVALGLATAFLVLLAGCLAWPSVLWDQFVYRYFWSSTEADALGHPVDGLTEDYNLVSTFVYGMVLAAAVYLIYYGFRKRNIGIDVRYILALVPFVLFGTLTRSLEDSFYFSLPAAYVFIAPQIYGLVGALTVGVTLVGRWRPRLGVPLLWLLVPFYLLLFMGGFSGAPLSEAPLLAGLTLVLLTAVLTFVMLRRGRDAVDLPSFLWPFGLQAAVAPLFLAAYWCAFPGAWGPATAVDIGLKPWELLVIFAIAAAVTALLWLLFAYLARRRNALAPLASGISALVIFGHMLDAAATYRAITLYGYGEKHVLAGSLIKWTGTALVMFPMKAIAIAVTLYILLVEFRDELEREKLLRGLLMAAILILGLSPGLRDMFRLVMGV